MKKVKDVIPEELQCSFCPAPFLSMQVNAFGSVGICPKSAGLFTLSPETSMTDKWHSENMEAIRQQFLNGQKPKECFRCWTEEKSGHHSLRQKYLEASLDSTNFDQAYIQKGNYRKGPEVLVIQVSNHCNFSCRTCHAIDSSGFNAEGEFYAKEYKEEKNRYLKRGFDGVIRDNRHYSELQLKEYSEVDDNLKRIEFFGGEPMLNPTHLALLKDLVDKNIAPGVKLMYSTNGSRPPTPEMLKLWNSFEEIELCHSLDGSKENFKYIRYPGDWNTTVENVKRLKKLQRFFGSNNFRVTSTITVSTLNIFNLSEIIYDIKESITENVDVNPVINPAYYSVANLPDEVKNIVIQRLRASPYVDLFQGIIKYMQENELQQDEFEKFIIWTIRKDKYRKQSFSQTFPEYYSVLEKYFKSYGSQKNLYKIISDGTY